MQITLYKAAAEVRELLDNIDPETGEFPEELEGARDVFASKSAAVVAYALEVEKVAGFVKAEAKELADKAKTMEKRAEWVRKYLSENMAATGIKEIKDERGTFTATLAIGRDESVDVFEPGLIPMEYLREIPAKHEPDKTLIKSAIKDGFDVPGARVVKRDRLTIK